MRNYVDPSVKLIDNSDPDSWYYTWIKSRRAILRDKDGNKIPLDTMDQLSQLPEEYYVGNELVKDSEYRERVKYLNLQFNDFPHYIFEIEGSCLFRDLLFNINKSDSWSESNRFLFSILPDDALYDEANYKISSEYKDIPEWEDQFTTYMNRIKSHPVTDENRIEMPYSISSFFWVGMNKKTLINTLSLLKMKMPYFYEIYGRKMLEVAGMTEKELVPYIDAGLSQYFIPEDESWIENNVTEASNFYIVNLNMGLILFSQFLRQNDTIIAGFFNELAHTDVEQFSHRVFKGNTPIKVTYVAHKDKLLRTIQNRSCNFAQHSGNDICSWTHFIQLFYPKLVKNTKDFKKMLPCIWNEDGSFKQCKFHDDVKFRKEGLEKRNTICPLIDLSLELAEIKHNRDKNIISEWYLKLTKELIDQKVNSGV